MRNKQLGKVGRIWREFFGKACSFCGGRTYQLGLNATGMSLCKAKAYVMPVHDVQTSQNLVFLL